MEKYFYHGIEGMSGYFSEVLNIILNILNEGLKTRNDRLDRNNPDYDKYNHVCLYQKNDDYDYSAPDALLRSARGGWIDHGFVIIVSPDVEATKVQVSDYTGFNEGEAVTNLVDEWRSNGSIPPSKFVGVALPYVWLKEDLDYCDEEEKRNVSLAIQKIESICHLNGWIIANSDEENFTDILDSSLNEMKRGKK